MVAPWVLMMASLSMKMMRPLLSGLLVPISLLVLHVSFAGKVFLDHPQNFWFVGEVAVHLLLGVSESRIYTRSKQIDKDKQK